MAVLERSGAVEGARRRIQEAAGEIAGRLRGRRVPTLLLGAIVAVFSWGPSIGSPGVGLDASWTAGLAIAAHRGLDFGTEIVFTYGPLGFLRPATLWYGDLAVLGFVYSAALYVALCVSLVWVLRRSLGAAPAALLAFAALVVLPSIEQPLILAAVWCLAVLSPRAPRLAEDGLLFAGATFAAIESLIKLSIGPVVFAACLIALVGARARWWRPAAFVALFCVELVLLWLVSGQPLGNLPDFVRNAEQIVSGYSQAMAASLAPTWQAPLAIGALLVVLAGAAFGSYRDGRARICGVAIVAVIGFVTFKQGFVRFEANHVAAFFSTICALWLVIPRGRVQAPVLVTGALVLAALTVHVFPTGGRLDVIENARLLERQVDTALSPGRQGELADSSRAALRSVYRLDQRMLAELRGRSVNVDPWEIGVIWAYDLEWAPLPVFQNYSAYTDRLDELNAEEIETPAGPQRVLRENPALIDAQYPTRTIDSRYPGWDPPAQALATLCHFVPVYGTTRWQVLARTADRCGEPRLIRSTEASFDTPVRVPAAGANEVVFARVHGAEVGGLEHLRALLFRPKFRYALLDGTTLYRLIPETADNGLLLSGGPGLAGTGPFSQVPQAETIELTGVGGDLRFDFFRMRVAQGRPAS